MKEHKNIIKLDKKLLVIILILIMLYKIFINVVNYLHESGLQEGTYYVLMLISFALILVPLIACIGIYGMYVLNFIEFKVLNKEQYNDLQDELSKDNVVVCKEGHIYITEKYIVSAPSTPSLYERDSKGTIIELNKLIWIYCDEEQLYSDDKTKRIRLVGADKTNKYVIARLKIKEEEILNKIMDGIKQKNPQTLVGYTMENREKYEEIKYNK